MLSLGIDCHHGGLHLQRKLALRVTCSFASHYKGKRMRVARWWLDGGSMVARWWLDGAWLDSSMARWLVCYSGSMSWLVGRL
jgi:hypothetical protein